MLKEGSKKGGIWDLFEIIILAVLLLLIPLLSTFAPSLIPMKLLPLLVGILIVLVGYYHLIYKLPRISREFETRLSMEALRVSFWLVIFGLIIIVLGVLYLMDILPQCVR